MDRGYLSCIEVIREARRKWEPNTGLYHRDVGNDHPKRGWSGLSCAFGRYICTEEGTSHCHRRWNNSSAVTKLTHASELQGHAEGSARQNMSPSLGIRSYGRAAKYVVKSKAGIGPARRSTKRTHSS